MNTVRCTLLCSFGLAVLCSSPDLTVPAAAKKLAEGLDASHTASLAPQVRPRQAAVTTGDELEEEEAAERVPHPFDPESLLGPQVG